MKSNSIISLTRLTLPPIILTQRIRINVSFKIEDQDTGHSTLKEAGDSLEKGYLPGVSLIFGENRCP
jgi:hypothetical protein